MNFFARAAFSLLIFSSLFFTKTSLAAENWKGKTDVSPIEVGLMTGTAIYGSSANWGVLASGAYQFNKDGFLEIALNKDSAVKLLGLKLMEAIRIEFNDNKTS